jgi:hypothetical protein
MKPPLRRLHLLMKLSILFTCPLHGMEFFMLHNPSFMKLFVLLLPGTIIGSLIAWIGAIHSWEFLGCILFCTVLTLRTWQTVTEAVTRHGRRERYREEDTEGNGRDKKAEAFHGIWGYALDDAVLAIALPVLC